MAVICADGKLTIGAYQTWEVVGYSVDRSAGYPASPDPQRPLILAVDGGIGAQIGQTSARNESEFIGPSTAAGIATPSPVGLQITRTDTGIYSRSVSLSKSWGLGVSGYNVWTEWKTKPVTIETGLCR